MKHIIVCVAAFLILTLGLYSLSSILGGTPFLADPTLLLDGPRLSQPQPEREEKFRTISRCPYFSDLREGYLAGRWQVSLNRSPIQTTDEVEALVSETGYAWTKAYKNYQQAYSETKLEFSQLECHYQKRRRIEGKPENYFWLNTVVVTYSKDFKFFVDLETQAAQWRHVFITHTTGAHIECRESREACWFSVWSLIEPNDKTQQ